MSAPLDALRTAILTNTLSAGQQTALANALAEISPFFPNPDEISNSIPPEEETLARIWIAALYAVQAGGGTGGLVPVTQGTVIVPNAAALSGTVVTGLPNGTPAIVETFGAEFSLQPIGTLLVDNQTVLASTDPTRIWERGDTVVGIAAQDQTVWHVNPLTGNNENTGLTTGSPLANKLEIMLRWGTWSPFILQAVTVFQDASDPSGDFDAWLATPNFVAGGSITYTAALPAPSFTGTLNVVTAKNRAANQALQSTFNTTTGAIAAGLLLVNATRGNSRAFVQRLVSGTNWQLTQPCTPYPGTGIASPTVVDTWATGDAITGYVLTAANIGILGGVTTDPPTGLSNPSHQAYNLTILDPSSGADVVPDLTIPGAVLGQITECVCQRSTAIVGATALPQQLANVFFKGAAFQGSGLINVSAGVIQYSIGCQGGSVTGQGFFIGIDAILYGGSAGAFASFGNSNLGNTFLDQGSIFVFGNCNINAGLVIYGALASNFIDVRQGAVSGFGTPGAATSFPLVGGLKIRGQTNAYSNLTTAGLVATHEVALSAANLDAAAGAAGFGGLAAVPGVGGFYGGAALP